MKNLFTKLFLVIALGVVISGCKKDDPAPGPAPIPPPELTDSRTLFVFIATNNTLSQYGAVNLRQIIDAAKFENIGYNKIITLYHVKNASLQLVEVSANAAGEGEMKVLKEYAEGATSDAAFLARTIADMQQYAPARSYGMIVGSHGSGWLPGVDSRTWWSRPASTTPSGFTGIAPSSITQDADAGYMELSDFAAAIPAGIFDFIVLDECYCAGIEVVHELHDKTDYLVMSAAEVVGDGMPYDKVVPPLFLKEADLGETGLSGINYNHYATHPYGGSWQSVSIVLVDCAKYDARLAAKFAAIMQNTREEIRQLPYSTTSIQFYDRSVNWTHHAIYDLVDYVENICGSAHSQMAQEFRTMVENMIDYKAISPAIFAMVKDPQKFCGLTSYIPFDHSYYRYLNREYTKTSWGQAVGIGEILDWM